MANALGSQAARGVSSGHNHYSAMPSLHVGWTAWCAFAIWLALRTSRPRLALLSWVFPLAVVAADVLTTGNHTFSTSSAAPHC